MKKLAKIVVFALVAVLCFGALAACTDSEQPATLKLYVPDGAPALAVAKIVKDKKIDNANVEATVTTGQDVIAKVTGGEADIAVLPTNAAAKLYNAGKDYVMVSVNVYGVLYLVGTKEAASLEDLKGQVVHSIGLSNTPEYVFKSVLNKQGVGFEEYDDGAEVSADKIAIKYYADGSGIIPLVLSGKADFAILGEPAVTTLKAKAAEKDIVVTNLFDLQQLWKDATESDQLGYPQACVIVKKSIATKEFVDGLLKALTDNLTYVKQNAAEVGEVLGTSTVYTAEIVDKCNLKVVNASEAKADVEKYLSAIQALYPEAVAKLPDGDFYYAPPKN